MDSEQESRWVAAAKAGDTGAYERLVDRYFRAAYGMAYVRLRQREAAEDLTQEVFLRAWMNLGQLRDASLFGGWLMRIVQSLASTWKSKGQRRSELIRMVPVEEQDLEAIESPKHYVAAAAAQSELEHKLIEAIQQLPDEDRQLVVMHFMQEVSQRQLADQLGVNHSTVSRRLDKAVASLRTSLGSKPTAEMLPRPRPAAKLATYSLIAAAASMSQDVSAKIATACANTPLPSAAPASLGIPNTILANLAVGAQIMTASQKILAVGAIAAAVFGWSAYSSDSRSAKEAGATGVAASGTLAATADLQESYAFGKDAEIALPVGKIVRVNFPKVPLKLKEFAKYPGVLKSFDVMALPDGGIKAVGLTIGNQVMPIDLTSAQIGEAIAGPVNVHIWQEMDLAFFQTMRLVKGPNGLTLKLFAVNKPELLPRLKAAEREVELGKISKKEGLSRQMDILKAEGMLPQDPDNAKQLESALTQMSK